MAAVDLSRVPSFYHGYIQRVDTLKLQEALQVSIRELSEYLQNLSPDQWAYRYEPGKWSIKEMAQHLIDAERIFNYRALCFARGETIALPGFDEDAYAANSEGDRRQGQELLTELTTLRSSTEQLFASMSSAQLQSGGVSNGKPIYVEAIGYIIAGHCLHHLAVLKERYLWK